MISRIALSEPLLSGNEWKYVKRCLDTAWVSSAGKFVERFESMAAGYVGRKYGVACTNGTAALHVSLLLAGVGAGDEVILPTLTFVAPANAVRYTGAYPVFLDVRADTWQLDVSKVAEFLRKDCRRVKGKLINRHTRRSVKAILPVHVLGHPVDMNPLMGLARQYGLKVIEDNAESLGAEYRGRKIGRHGLLTCLSFNGNKVITCGGGGMILTDDRRLADRARYLTTQAKDDPFENIHGAIGFNYRLTNVQAALGVAQLEKLDGYVAKKRKIAGAYRSAFSDVGGISCQHVAPGTTPSWWLFTVLVDPKHFGMDSRKLMRRLAEKGIETRPFWHPLHSQKIFANCYASSITVADRLYREGVSLPSSVGLSPEQQGRVIAAVKQIGRKT